MSAFTEKLDKEALDFFNNVTQQPFSKQAVAFLNAYWNEVGSQAPFIFHVAYEQVKAADMRFKGVSLIHLYEEGNDLDFNEGLYFYELLCKTVLEKKEGEVWRNDAAFQPSMPEMLTAIVRKKELREKVDVNFDGRISFLEYLLYQYREWCNPAEFIERSMRQDEEGEHPEITKARLALEDVTAAIRAYEREKQRLTEESEKPGVKGLSAKHTLAQLESSPLMEKLNTALIKAEAAVRKATKLFAGVAAGDGSGEGGAQSEQSGALFWMNSDLEIKQRLYGSHSNKAKASNFTVELPKTGAKKSEAPKSAAPVAPVPASNAPPKKVLVPKPVVEEEPEPVDDGTPRACGAFDLDMSASTFGTCKCGFKKSDHSSTTAKPVSRGGNVARLAAMQAEHAAHPESTSPEKPAPKVPMPVAAKPPPPPKAAEPEPVVEEAPAPVEEEQPSEEAASLEEPPAVEDTAAAAVEEEEAPAPPVEEEGGEYPFTVYALFDYESGESTDLPFRVGDAIEVIAAVDDAWWRGTCNGAEGIFPVAYVSRDASDIPATEAAAEEEAPLEEVAVEETSAVDGKYVVAQFDSSEDAVEGDLVFKTGDRILVVEEVDENWIQGSLNGSTGLVPVAYVTAE